ncbi:MAG: hypothetical protein K2N05_07895 [Muribaculaceae bacterium]|nr:hypothetical protein [Muribaculaceae bacterium]
MKFKYFTLIGTLAFLAASCNGGDKSGATAEDSQSVQPPTEVVATDSSAVSADTIQQEEKTPVEEVKEETKETSKPQNAVSDEEVNKIISMIEQHTETVAELKKEGISPASSMAFRAVEALPDYTKLLKKVKKNLSPEQAARIKEAEKKFKKVADSWQ